jgi:thiol-disulfide isomerase/thioredoxin
MKKIITLFALLACNVSVFAQFKLSGKINNYKGNEELKINIPQVYGYSKGNSIDLPVAADGTFSIVLPVKKQRFANLIFKKRFHTLLLNTNKNLVIGLDEQNKKLETITGSALNENAVLTAVDMEELPGFLKNTNALGTLNREELYKKVVTPYLAGRDEKIRIVNQSSLPLNDKKLIASEIKYMAFNYLNDLKWLSLKNKNTIDSLVVELFNVTETRPEYAVTGPQYYTFANNYLGNMQLKAFFKVKQENIKPSQPIPYFEISVDSAKALVKKYGSFYMQWYSANKFLPAFATEQLTYQEIANNYNEKDLEQLKISAKILAEKFPKSPYNTDAKQKIKGLKELLLKNETNPNIVVFDNYKNTTSIYDVIKSLKGKVVYLDVWGTWCGPCKEQLTYTPKLKEIFEGKDVAFVYLDLDDEDKDTAWKHFIKINAITGMHIRKSRATIVPFWKELLADNPNKEEYYPQYFIFDKEGKLVISKALTPRDGKALYNQINSVLNK